MGGDNWGYSGAIRHAYWMYSLANKLGPELAEYIGKLHEDFEIGKGEYIGMHNALTDDSKMDVINNTWGINLAKTKPGLSSLDFEDAFFNAVKNPSKGNSIRIDDIKTIPKQSLKTGIESRRKHMREFSKDPRYQKLMSPSIKY